MSSVLPPGVMSSIGTEAPDIACEPVVSGIAPAELLSVSTEKLPALTLLAPAVAAAPVIARERTLLPVFVIIVAAFESVRLRGIPTFLVLGRGFSETPGRDLDGYMGQIHRYHF